MIKLIFCLRRNPAMTMDEFRRYWREDHAERVRRNNPVGSKLRRYTQSHTFHDPRLQPMLDSRGSQIPPFDGIAEAWFESVEALTSTKPTEESIAIARETLADEAKFIDMENSVILFADEHVIIDR